MHSEVKRKVFTPGTAARDMTIAMTALGTGESEPSWVKEEASKPSANDQRQASVRALHEASSAERGEVTRYTIMTVRVCTILTGLCIGVANSYVIAEGGLSIIAYVRRALTALMAVVVIVVELHVPDVARTAVGGALTRSFIARGGFLMYIGVDTWNEDAPLTELANVGSVLTWTFGGMYILLGACCCAGPEALETDEYEAIPNEPADEETENTL